MFRPDEISRELKRRAAEAGLAACGIAAAAPLERDGAALSAWLRNDRQAGMAWLARGSEKRRDPTRLLEGCRSVIAFAMNYATDDLEERSGRAARVARYAQSRDYHRVLGAKLRDLATWLESVTGLAARAFVDTGPVLERAWAERAGLGWIGKNANLISRARGSWLLLGEILSAAELPADPGPHADSCGSCTACLEACPTAAIVAPGVVDSNLCISYWTIEHRGAIPRERRAGIGDWIFGCDVCQEVCPWNETFARPASAELIGRRDDLRDLDPEQVLALDETEFRRRYSGTPLMRAKWEGMRRNACVVLGNRGEPAAIPALTRALGDADPVVRDHAAWAIAAIERAQNPPPSG